MIDFSSYTQSNLMYQQLQRITDAIDKREGSMIYTALGPATWTIEGFYFLLNQVQKNAWVLTAVGEYLDYKTQERGIYRNVSTAAKRDGIFNVEVPAGFRCSTINGADSLTFYAMDNCRLENDGKYHVTLVCETIGTGGNDYYGNVLPITFVSQLTYAEIGDILIPGTSEESDDALRARYILSLQDQPFAGNIASYRQAILDIDNVGSVQVYPVWDGGGTVKCSILDSNYNIASVQLIEDVQNYICPPEDGETIPSQSGYGLAPIGALVTISTATEHMIDLETTVTLQPGYSISSVQADVETVFANYLLEIRKVWGNPVSSTLAKYIIYVYISQINAAILNIEGVVNVTGTTLNGYSSDIQLNENGSVQEIPVVGGVVAHESA